MITALELAQICADVYAVEPVGFAQLWNFGGTVAALRRRADCDVIVFRGSLSVVDWMRDVEAVPVWDPRIGFVHGGFLCGVNDVFIAAALNVGRKVVVTGHSLGGARARIFAALCAYHNSPVAQCTVFGSPRPGFANLRRVLEKSGTPLASYRNRNDPVPIVPFLGGLYEHTDQWQAVDSAPAAGDLEPLRDHHMARYIDGLARLQPAPLAAASELLPA